MQLGIVTATTDRARADACIESWHAQTTQRLPMVIVENGTHGDDYLGTVPAFRRGVEQLLHEVPDVDVIACLHDDLRIDTAHWDAEVLRCFARHPRVGLAGFGGAIGLGADDLYQVPYDPMQLARFGFRSNLVDAEAHGSRSLLPEPVVCLDGFSQIGRKAFWQGWKEREVRTRETYRLGFTGPWQQLEGAGFVHHFYDGALGCIARRLGWQVYYLPVRCHHFGGQTAVGDAGYQRWAAQEIDGGDRGFWEAAHRIGYDLFRDVLPLRVQVNDDVK